MMFHHFGVHALYAFLLLTSRMTHGSSSRVQPRVRAAAQYGPPGAAGVTAAYDHHHDHDSASVPDRGLRKNDRFSHGSLWDQGSPKDSFADSFDNPTAFNKKMALLDNESNNKEETFEDQKGKTTRGKDYDVRSAGIHRRGKLELRSALTAGRRRSHTTTRRNGQPILGLLEDEDEDEQTTCQTNKAPIRVEVQETGDSFSAEAAWNVKEIGRNEPVLFSSLRRKHRPPAAEDTTLVTTRCVDSTKCYQFIMNKSSAGDHGQMGQFKVVYESRIVIEGSWGSSDSDVRSALFGDGCLLPPASPKFSSAATTMAPLQSGFLPTTESPSILATFPTPKVVLSRTEQDGSHFLPNLLEMSPNSASGSPGPSTASSQTPPTVTLASEKLSVSVLPTLGKATSPPSTVPSISRNGLQCRADEIFLRIDIRTDDYPGETGWQLMNFNKNPGIVSESKSGEYENANELYIKGFCVDSSECFLFTIFDTASDGICCNYGNGWYKVFYDDYVIAEGGQFGSSEETSIFGNGCPSLSPTVSSGPTSRVAPTTVPTISRHGLQCRADEIFLRIDIRTNGWPRETGWQLMNFNKNPGIFAESKSGEYKNANELYVKGFCVDSLEYFLFTIFDAYSDGICCNNGNGWYKVFYDDYIVAEGGQFGFSENSIFGNDCPSLSPTVSSGPTSSTSEVPSGVPSASQSPSTKPSLSPSRLPSTSPSKSPSTKPTLLPSGLPSTSPSPTVAPTERIIYDLIDIDEHGRRYFPRHPPLQTETSSFVYPLIPSCSTSSSDAHPHVGCIDIATTVKMAPYWAGKILSGPPDCNASTQTCEINIPVSRRELSTPILAKTDNKFTLSDLPGGSMETHDIATGDVNGDGYPDIVIGNNYNHYNQIYNQILLNRGDGSFQDPVNLPGGEMYTRAIEVADMNADGNIDILVGNAGQSNLLLLNRGDGTFDDPIVLPGGEMGTRSMAVADMDGDGSLDVVIGNRAGYNHLLLNDHSNHALFSDFVPLPGEQLSTSAVAVADVDGDGFNDIIVGNDWHSANQILLNRGDGSFADPIILPGGTLETEAIAVADLDGDGAVDVIFGNMMIEGSNQVLINKGNGRFHDPISIPGIDTYSLAVADFDGDGTVDIVVGDEFGTRHRLLLNQEGNGLIYDVIDLPGRLRSAETYAVALADLNRDNTVDIVLGRSSGVNEVLINNDVEISLNDPIDLPGGADEPTTCIAVADVDGDGSLDIIIGNGYYDVIDNGNGQRNQLLMNQRDAFGTFKEPIALPGGEIMYTISIAAADMNGDGSIDIIIGNYGQSNQLLLNQGDGSFSDPINIPTGDEGEMDTRAIAIADIDGDGLLDIITGNSNGQKNQVILSEGNGSFDEIINLPGGDRGTTLAIAVADIDNDGLIDIIIGNRDDPNEVLLNKGGGLFDDPVVLPAGGDDLVTFAITVADVDGDGSIDIIIGTYFDGNLLLINQGDGSFDDPIYLPGGEKNTVSIGAADIDGDGLVDIIIGSGQGVNILLLNRGDASFSDPIELPGNDADTTAIAFGDVDNDGTIDIILGNDQDRNILIHATHCPTGGARLHSASWCFDCPSYMGVPTANGGVQKLTACVECLPDYVQQDGAEQEQLCTQCILGERKFGNDVCVPCPDGSYYNNVLERNVTNSSTWQHDRCVECPAGQYSSSDLTAINECFQCRAGTYQPDRGSSSCRICDVGTYQVKQGQAACEQCVTGGYCNATNSFGGGYRPCPPGTYNDKKGMSDVSSCVECPRGTYSIRTGANSSASCLPCQPGTFNDETGQTKCKLCEEGSFQNISSQIKCTECDSGSYADKPGLIECIRCPHRLDSVGGSYICPFCSEGFYLNDSYVSENDIFQSPSQHCLDCPTYLSNTTCPFKNTTLQTLTVPAGFWRASLDTSQMYKCENKNVCIGSAKDTLLNEKRISEKSSLMNNSSGVDLYCSEGHRGPLCEVCVDNSLFYFSRINGRCLECPPLSRLALQASLIIIMVLICYAFYKYAPKQWYELLYQIMSRLSFIAKLKILISFYQVVSSLEVVYGVKISHELIAWFNVFQYLSLDVFDVLVLPKSCIGSMKQQLIVGGLWPFMLLFLGALGILVHILYKMRIKNKSARQNSPQGENVGTGMINDEKISMDLLVKRGIYRLINLSIVILYFTIPTVSRGIFDAIKCRSFQVTDYGNPPFLFRSYLLVDMDIECSSENDDQFRDIQAIFRFFFVLWPILIPLGFLALLMYIRQAIKTNRVTPLANACRFLWNDYDESVWFWDVIDLWRKIFLSGFIMIFDTQEGSMKIVRLIIAACVSTLFLGILAISRPYKRQHDLFLAFVSNLLLATCFSAGIILRHCDEDQDDYSVCNTFIGQSFDSFRASIIVIASIVSMLFIATAALVVLTINAIRVPTVRLSSGHSPNLEISENCATHAFMSHVWATGQAKTHAITRKLQLHLPRLKLWLDVNDLQDMDKLEEHVAEAEVFILFYSDGYFRSRNCRREIYEAVRLEKPVIVLYEGDDSVVEALRAECQDHCIDSSSPGPSVILQHMFGNESSSSDVYPTPPILWLNQNVYSAAALKLIYFRIFSHLPHYKKHPQELSGGISVPGELVPQSPLRNELNLLICKENEGAEELARELRASLSEAESLLMKITDAEEYFHERNAGEDSSSSGGGAFDASSSFLLRPSNAKSRSTVLLLYLNEEFFKDDTEGALRHVVQSSLEDPDIGVILVHEQDVAKGACPFDVFFRQVPQNLIDPPCRIFNDIAIPLYSIEEYRIVSLGEIMGRLTAQLAIVKKSSYNNSTSGTSTPAPARQVKNPTQAEDECDELLVVDDSLLQQRN